MRITTLRLNYNFHIFHPKQKKKKYQKKLDITTVTLSFMESAIHLLTQYFELHNQADTSSTKIFHDY